ncbi:malto-oligosyltrehalose synthase [Skermanella pratensis]|uniref:malto-oligosyltrehalose synthase n=1 Tax=Skermanella pratensis TaxID=2233999 RepID=UPI0013011C72|nr:malto-oligosyltrehalose synthase [Skermanella pratensis]
MNDSSGTPIPRATYRLQFNKDFQFDDASALTGYMARLGISHLYASPYMKARPGSTHGYDIVDHNAINPELGGEEGFKRLIAALKQAGLGQIVDFVPNHMGVGGADNAWWLNILEWGQDSAYAGYLDIDWEPDRRFLQGKLLIPFLGDQYGKVLEDGDLALKFDAEEGSFAVWAYGTHKLPICPLNYAEILGHDNPDLENLGDAFGALPTFRPHVERRASELKAELASLVAGKPEVAEAVEVGIKRFTGTAGQPDSFRALHELIQQQNWRAAYFKVAADDINYRRFFNINELAGLRMEQPELFELSHQLVLSLVEDGTLDGIRIDHIDGLVDPKGYCIRLREKAPRPFYLVVEKILAHHEHLREDWPIEGTTGYEFTNLVGGIFVDASAEESFNRIYTEFTGQTRSFEDIVHESKIRIMEHEMASELNVLARDAARIARSNWRTADFTNNILHSALKEIVARFPVYRTYIDGSAPAESDRRYIDWAIAQARRAVDAADPSVFDFLQALLTGDLVAEPRSGYSRFAVIRLAMRVQQYSGPVMAKGLEDTAFYRYNRLVSLNEVGGHPELFGVSVSAFHHANAERARRWPHAMLGTSTHDTKRGEDTRARINVLSEIPEEWERQIRTWSRMIRARRGDMAGTAPPDKNDEYLLYQLLVGSWPAELTNVTQPDAALLKGYIGRVEGAMIKSIREAKVHSTWAAPNTEYEEAVIAFLHECLDVSRRSPFLEAFVPFQARVARLGALNGLAQALLKLTVPGVPDIYQGSEMWNLSLVDPDNRLPVDYDMHQRALDQLEGELEQDPACLPALFDHWQDGVVKLAVTRQALKLRGEKPELFAHGSYEALAAQGAKSDQVCAFARIHEGASVIVAVPRLVARLEDDPDWGDTAVVLPTSVGAGRWRNLLTDAVVEAEPREDGAAFPAGKLMGKFPFALLVPEA